MRSQDYLSRIERALIPFDRRAVAHRSLLEDYIPERLRAQERFAGELESFAYGDTPPRVFHQLLTWAGARPGDSLLDLGCGCGGPVLVASFMMEAARGIDLLPGVVAVARQAAETLQRDNAAFEVGDIATATVRETLVYVAATSFSTRLLGTLTSRLAAAPAGTRVLILGKQLQGPGLRRAGATRCTFSWTPEGEGSEHEVFLYERV